jgi:hypothetical protein
LVVSFLEFNARSLRHSFDRSEVDQARDGSHGLVVVFVSVAILLSCDLILLATRKDLLDFHPLTRAIAIDLVLLSSQWMISARSFDHAQLGGQAQFLNTLKAAVGVDRRSQTIKLL